MATRQRPTALGIAPAPMPGDVRLMNAVAALIVAGTVVALLVAGVIWLTRTPAFTIRVIDLDGDLARNSVPTVRANALPLLEGNFFSIDLARARQAFESVPWVRRAVVRRVFPDRLSVRLEEHHAAALWEGAGGADRLVNSQGEVFDANLGDVEDEDLPVFAGPDGASAQVLALWRRLQPVFTERGSGIERLSVSSRGSWRAELENGSVVEMGRGSEDEVVQRTERFVRSVTQLTSRYRQTIEYADLRHTDGYALKLRNVTTGQPVPRERPGATTN